MDMREVVIKKLEDLRKKCRGCKEYDKEKMACGWPNGAGVMCGPYSNETMIILLEEIVHEADNG